MGRRRLVMFGIAGGFVAAGLLVLADQALVASLLQPFLGSSAGSGSIAGAGLTPYGSLSYVAYAVGFGLLMTGVGIARSTMHASLSSYASGGSAMGAAGFSPEAMQNLMATSMARVNASAASPAPVVKVKCAKCGSLEEEDAAYCHKCGAPM